jgi:hypothetical protein
MAIAWYFYGYSMGYLPSPVEQAVSRVPAHRALRGICRQHTP